MLHSYSVESNKDDKVWEKAGGRVVNKNRYNNDRFGSQQTNTIKQCGRQNLKNSPHDHILLHGERSFADVITVINQLSLREII